MTGLEKLNVAVLLGGPSAEREVSLRSGAAVARALRGFGHRVEEIDPQPGKLSLPAGTDVAFLALHGTYGEDGEVQSELEKLGVPYTGCGVETSRVAFDKIQTKQRCAAAGICTPRFEVLHQRRASWPEGWRPPVVLKPTRGGSSLGLQFVERVEDFDVALAEALQHGPEILMEEKIIGREVTVGILAGKALPVVEIRPKQGHYDYRNKYTKGATEYFFPAEFPEEATRRIQSAAVRAFDVVGGRDYARVDVMVREDGEPMVLEVNTLPGMTETSLLPMAAAAAGIGFGELCQRMLELALARAPLAAKGICP
ncbi:MAG: D-alanine--D-alanine ligase [Verrucomicrobia bacterium]|nr:D-alanine--D-alanine ligase [Verrucomicrobiota bacterium]